MPPPGTYPPQDAGRSHTTYPPTPGEGTPRPTARPDAGTRPTNSRNSSWDILSGAKNFGHDVEHFDPRTSSAPHLRMAEGDLPNNRVAKFYAYLLSASMVTRWIIYIVPILALLWIPGILSFTAFPQATMADVNLRWWSIWFSVLWGGYWAALAASMLLPLLLRGTIGVVAVGTRRYIDWLRVLNRYVAIFGWAIASFASFKPLITNHNEHPDDDPSSGVQSAHKATSTIFKILFGIVLCSAILLAEKLLIQMIGSSYHQRSYADRLEEQRRNTRSLVILYQNSTDQAGRSDTLHDAPNSKNVVDPKRLLKTALKGVRGVAESTTQAFGNIASEIIGSSVLQPNSPQAMVATALSSANKTRLLARRLYYSFRSQGADAIVFNDIAQYFPSHEAAMDAFNLFDKDGNGDATRDEMELACMEVHRERLALAASMRDIDSAVGRLDNILMTLYIAVAIIVMAVTLDAELSTLVVGASTFLLALSWLIGGTAQEILTSIIFLFVKHMYDVGDRIEFDGQAYVVKEIRLLSTILIDVNKGSQVQAPNLVLNGKLITNIRRSPPMSEPFEFEVAFNTTFSQIEQLRAKMLAFVKSERRDYLPTFDIVVQDVPQQSKMVLQTSIKYKSNAQQGALKAQRRNKWICALKESLADVKIFGPSGDPGAVADPTKYTLVPWEEVKAGNQPAGGATPAEPLIPRADWQLTDRNAVILDDSRDVYGETDELHMTQPRARDEARTRPAGSSALGTSGAGAGSSTARQQAPLPAAEVFEMTGRPQ